MPVFRESGVTSGKQVAQSMDFISVGLRTEDAPAVPPNQSLRVNSVRAGNLISREYPAVHFMSIS